MRPAELPNDRSTIMAVNTVESPLSQGALLTPGEVAVLFRVDPKTVTRWAQAGKLSAVRTLGGHRRFHESEVRSLLTGVPTQRGE
jgi:excisionase family DNA binding protein